MIQQRHAVRETTAAGGGGDEYLEELRNDHLGLVGASPALVALRDLIRRVASSSRPVLISGPTGAGKSLVAEAISRLGGAGGQGEGSRDHQDTPVPSLARVNCAEVDEKSLELILFGTDRQPGLLGAGKAATLVLDDVDALPESLQCKVVRLLQSGTFRPIGSSAERPVSIRVLAITSRSLPRCVRENTFRADLLYELGVLTVSVPGLDEHRDDIPALVNHFLRLSSNRSRISPDALNILVNRTWPGGVRELRNLMERAVIASQDNFISVEAIQALCAPEPMEGAIEGSLVSLAERLLDLPIGNKLAALEAALLESAMRVSRGNKSAAARLLGLHRKAVERKLEKYEVRFVTGPAPARVFPAAVPGPTANTRELPAAVPGPTANTREREHDLVARNGAGPISLQS